MRVQLRQGHESHLADVDLEQEVREARLFAEDEVFYPPWTGLGFLRLGRVPELAEAFEAPPARFAAHLRARSFPFATLLLVTVVAFAGIVQSAASVMGVFSPEIGARVEKAVMLGATGYEPLLLDGGWWTPWTSQLLHVGMVHLVMNLPVLAYSGFRVERALGRGGLAVVAASSVLGGTVLITAFGTLPVLGASILGYGLWGAQIAVGFRAGEAIPPGFRGFYGWGNLVLFVPLFAAGLGADGVSDLGHIGGLLGGVAAAFLVPSEAYAPSTGFSSRRSANFRLAAMLGALPMLGAPLLSRAATALAVPDEHVEVDSAGVSLDLPWRMAENPVRYGGLPAWVVSRNHDEPVFCGLFRLRSSRDLDEDVLRDTWAEALQSTLEPLEAPPPIGPGWTSRAWAVRGEDGELTGRLVEHDLRRGAWLLRAGYHVRSDADPSAGRESLYRHVLTTIEVHEPPALAEARRQRDLYPQSPEVAWTFARELARAGQAAEADGVWAGLLARDDAWATEAGTGRVSLWAELAENGEDVALDATVPLDTRVAWLTGWISRSDTPDTVVSAGLRWLAARGRCAEVRAHLAASPPRDDTADLLLVCGDPAAPSPPPPQGTP